MGVVGEAASPAAGFFHRRMLWHEGERPEPVVALLGPSGSGKSTALEALADACGSTVVHARLDFGVHDVEPISAAALVTFEMMREWANRRRPPVFHRFGLGLLALNEPLPEDRVKAQARITELIADYVRDTRPGRTATGVERVAGDVLDVVASGVLSHLGGPNTSIVEAARERAKPVIGALLRAPARWSVRGARRWWRTGGTSHVSDIDALIAISRGTRASATGYLMRALLADIRENAVVHPPMRSGCDCLVPVQRQRRRHDHAWMLLVDNADTDQGRRFLSELTAARCHRAVPPDGHPAQSDPLLVVAACGQWRPEWARWWCEPWRTEPRPGSAQRRIPLFSRATHELWAGRGEPALARAGETSVYWYPVWLDPMSEEQTNGQLALRGADIGVPALGELAHRLSGGHCRAVRALGSEAEALSGRDPGAAQPLDGRRLMRSRADERQAALWQRAVESCVPGAVNQRTWARVPRIVTASVYLADRLGERDSLLPAAVSEISATLDALRKDLWISTFAARPSPLWTVAYGDTDHPAMLHPWLARCLLLGLADTTARVGPSNGDAWDGLFQRLGGALAPGAEREGGARDTPDAVARRLYYDLARGRFLDVAGALAERFDRHDHREWLRLLDQVSSAPCRPVTTRTPAELYEESWDDTSDDTATTVQVACAKLLALLWVRNDSLALTGRRWDAEIREGFTRLKNNSNRRDVGPLEEAAARFAR